MTQVVQDAEKQHDIERADTFGRKLHHVDVDVFDARTERLASQTKAGLRTPARSVPRKMVRRNDAGRAAPLAFKREEAIPRADIKHRQPVK